MLLDMLLNAIFIPGLKNTLHKSSGKPQCLCTGNIQKHLENVRWTNGFHGTFYLFINRLLLMSKCGKNKKGGNKYVKYLCLYHTLVFSVILLNKCMATWNPFVIYQWKIEEKTYPMSDIIITCRVPLPFPPPLLHSNNSFFGLLVSNRNSTIYM